MILISSCLVGINCRYDGKNNLNNICYKLYNDKKAIIACPECLGGMETPRLPSEIIGYKTVISRLGDDVSSYFCYGAKKGLEIALKHNVKYAILKSKSPSCGFGQIYDGTFSKTLINGNGIFADLLVQNGVSVINSDDTKKIEEIALEIL